MATVERTIMTGAPGIEDEAQVPTQTIDDVLKSISVNAVKQRLATDYHIHRLGRGILGRSDDDLITDTIEAAQKNAADYASRAQERKIPEDVDLPIILDTRLALNTAVQDELFRQVTPGRFEKAQDIIKYAPDGRVLAVTQYQDAGLASIISAGDTPVTHKFYVRTTRLVDEGSHLDGVRFSERAEVGEPPIVSRGHKPQIVLRREFPTASVQIAEQPMLAGVARALPQPAAHP